MTLATSVLPTPASPSSSTGASAPRRGTPTWPGHRRAGIRGATACRGPPCQLGWRRAVVVLAEGRDWCSRRSSLAWGQRVEAAARQLDQVRLLGRTRPPGDEHRRRGRRCGGRLDREVSNRYQVSLTWCRTGSPSSVVVESRAGLRRWLPGDASGTSIYRGVRGGQRGGADAGPSLRRPSQLLGLHAAGVGRGAPRVTPGTPRRRRGTGPAGWPWRTTEGCTCGWTWSTTTPVRTSRHSVRTDCAASMHPSTDATAKASCRRTTADGGQRHRPGAPVGARPRAGVAPSYADLGGGRVPLRPRVVADTRPWWAGDAHPTDWSWTVASPWWQSRGTWGGYQLGHGWPWPSWLQWNDRFRDQVRGFVRGEPGLVRALRQRVQGSPDLFGPDGVVRSLNSSTRRRRADAPRLSPSAPYDRQHAWDCGPELRLQATAELLRGAAPVRRHPDVGDGATSSGAAKAGGNDNSPTTSTVRSPGWTGAPHGNGRH